MNKTKNYNTNNAIKLCSAEITRLKKDRQVLKEELKTVKKSTSLGNFATAKLMEHNLLTCLQQTKEKITSLRQLNKRYIKEANGGLLPSQMEKCKNEQPKQTCKDDRFIDFSLSREDVISLVNSLNVWIAKSRGTAFADKVKLSMLKSKLA